MESRENDIILHRATVGSILALGYQMEGRETSMRDLLLKNMDMKGEPLLVMEDTVDGSIAYSLMKEKESVLTDTFTVQSKTGGTVAQIKREHILFMPAKLPKLTVTTEDGIRFTVKKEMEQLTDTILVEGENLEFKGELYSKHFQLLCSGQCIGTYACDGTGCRVSAAEGQDGLRAVLAAFALELARYR